MKSASNLATAILLGLFYISGCGGASVPAEATGDPVPVDYQEQQMKAQEEAMKKATGQ